MAQHRYLLPEDRIPAHWYNIAADLPSMPPPPLNPGTGQPLGPEALAGIFPMSLIEQEVSTDRYIAIPDPVREIYAMWRPTPMYRALGLEKALGTTCKIFYKYEGVSPAGSHKPNTSVPQAYYNAQAGIKRLTTETGAGQWGSSLSFACNLFDIECKVFMVRVSYDSKPYRRMMMETWGGECVASPSEETNAGRAILAEHPDSPGSLGIAISEAVEQAAMNDDTNYALGSVLNHVLLHQTVVGEEAKEQMEMAGAYPDVVIGCVGGGSNFGGLAFPFLQDKIAGKDIRIVAVEPASCPTLTRVNATLRERDGCVNATIPCEIWLNGRTRFAVAMIEYFAAVEEGAAAEGALMLPTGVLQLDVLQKTTDVVTFHMSTGPSYANVSNEL